MMRKRRGQLHKLIPQRGKRLPHRVRRFGNYGCHPNRIEGQGNNLASDKIFARPSAAMRQYLTIWESELRVFVGLAVLCGEIECSINLFGLWTRGGRLCIFLALAPGPKAIQTACYCEQDAEFFRQASQIIETRLGIQWTAEAHNHHSLGLQSPSSFDVHQVQRITSRNHFRRWAELITTFNNGAYTSRVSGRYRRNTARWADSPQVKVSGVLYTDPQRGEKIPVPLRILDGISPFRLRVLADGILDSADIGEYASDFPMEQISYKAFNFEEQYSKQAKGIPESLALPEQCAELPEEAQSDINIWVDDEQGLVTVTLPLPDGSTANIGYSHRPTHLIESVSVQGDDDKDSKDVTEALLSHKRDLTLHQIYELLVLSKQRQATDQLRGSERHEPMPESLAEQSRLLPEDVRDQIGFCVQQDLAIVTLPLPDGRTAQVSYGRKPPHSIQSVSVQSNDHKDEDMEDVTSALLADRCEITLNRIYEVLVAQINRKEATNADGGTM